MKEFEKDKQEAYGLLGFYRQTSSDKHPLFGSSIKHSNTIALKIQDASVHRGLHKDWFHGDNLLIEVEMSQSQFAEAITSMNMNDGIPCTIRYIQGKGRIPDIEFKDTVKKFNTEFSFHIINSADEARQLLKDTNELFSNKASIGKRDREEILNRLSQLITHLDGNSKFIVTQFENQMDKTVTEAKAEIEAFIQNKMSSIASQSIADKQSIGLSSDILSITNGDDGE